MLRNLMLAAALVALVPASALADQFIQPPEDAPEAAAAHADAAAAPAAARKPDIGPLRADPGDQCPPRDAPDNAIVVCAVVDGERFASHRVVPNTGGVMRPNRPLVVWVKHPADLRVDIQTEGQMGVYYAQIRKPPGVGPAARGGGAAGPPPRVVTKRTLPPPAPPNFSLILGLHRPGEEAVLDQLRVELFVERTFSGAIRVGLAGVGLGAVNANYSVGTPEGGKQPQIIANDLDPFEYELVVGYAPFFDEGGRPRSGCSYKPWCFAPYLGLGLLSPGDVGPQFLTSLHLGIEWEPVDAFSVAFTAVGRRVRRLSANRRVGGPAVPGEELTTDSLALGAGIVFNVSPSFLALSTSPMEMLR